MVTEPSAPLTLRPSSMERVVDLCVVAGMALAAINARSWWATVVAVAFSFVSLRFVLAQVVVDDRGLTVTNVLRRHDLPWPAIARFEVDSHRVAAVLDSGGMVPLLGVGVPGWWRSRQQRFEAIVSEIEARRPRQGL